MVELISVGTPAAVATHGVDAIIATARRTVALVLVDALIVVKVLYESVGTTAAIATHEILQS